MEQQSIQINIADRSYPLRIPAADEEKIRAAAKIINEKTSLYRKRYANRDTQDALSMALLQFVIRLIEAEQNEEATQIVEELKSLDNLLDDYIKINLV
ncbi:MAG: cell division protein ZapA [Bacteroidales bacterium]|jgi:cell division protein ZapA|nr:cell division protein ZapA [Bacteroidales bacterium]PKP00553.1 MAG: cell division protein ZapA [Bacteroidetes bacterium HGW-Bacteroidetes-8]